MKIACLQFAPQVGEVDFNLTRADAVLSKANPAELEELDLLVLPELAFTGYNFKSLQEISPYLEPAGSGISALWARTTALKLDCNVVLGYPEKVDVAPMWPASPEYYNSSILVNGDGETVANYRKSFLYYVDEKWALEGKDGFYDSWVSGLGNIAMGLCSDLNPYKLEAPWLAFEFAFHILQVDANLVIVSMAWPTSEDGRHYSRTPQEPDMDTITYWVQRLEPVIRAEKDEEVIVVFCNRTGREDNMTYAGSSAVIGIKGGEVCVYGLLGRGVKELLVVDTDLPAFAKLVQRAEPDIGAHSEADQNGNQSLLLPSRPPAPPPPEDFKRTRAVSSIRRAPSPTEEKKRSQAASPSMSKNNDHDQSNPTTDTQPVQSVDVRAHAAFEECSSPAPIRTSSNPISPRIKALSPRLEIPTTDFHSNPPSLGTRASETVRVSETASPNVDTPTAPSPTPLHLRPKLLLPTTDTEFRHVLTPYPGMGGNYDQNEDDDTDSMRVRPFIYEGSVTVTTDVLTPSTPYLEFARENSSQDSKFFGMSFPQSVYTSVTPLQPGKYNHAISGLGGELSTRPAQSSGYMPPRPFRSPASSNTPPQGSRENPKKVRTSTPIDPQPPAVTFPTSTWDRYHGSQTHVASHQMDKGQSAALSGDQQNLPHRHISRANHSQSPFNEKGATPSGSGECLSADSSRGDIVEIRHATESK